MAGGESQIRYLDITLNELPSDVNPLIQILQKERVTITHWLKLAVTNFKLTFLVVISQSQ